MESYFKRVQRQTQSRFWINNVTRKEAALAIEAGACGCTQNPSYTWKMLSDPEDREYIEKKLVPILKSTKGDNEAELVLQAQLVEQIAALFKPIWESSGGKFGYVSIQGDPFDETTETIVRLAHEHKRLGPNIMIKIPVTEEGLEAIRECVREGLAVNATEVMSLRQAMDVCDVYEEASRSMKNPPKVYLSHIAGIFDEYLGKVAASQDGETPTDLLWHAGKAVAQKIRTYMDERDTAVGFINGGARGLHHFTEWVGGQISTTINWKGTADELIRQNPAVVSRFDNPISPSVVDALLEQYPDFRKAWDPKGLEPSEYEGYGPVVLFNTNFRTAWERARQRIAELRATGIS